MENELFKSSLKSYWKVIDMSFNSDLFCFTHWYFFGSLRTIVTWINLAKSFTFEIQTNIIAANRTIKQTKVFDSKYDFPVNN